MRGAEEAFMTLSQNTASFSQGEIQQMMSILSVYLHRSKHRQPSITFCLSCESARSQQI